jgi:hypothetical protein
MLLKKMLTLLLLTVYVVIPLADSVACDDCSLSATLHQENDVFAADVLKGPASSGLSMKHSGDLPGGENGVDVQCPLCCNSASGSGAFCGETFLFAMPSQDISGLIAYLDPSFPIAKPPQN